MIDEETKKMTLIEVTVPYNVFLKQSLQNRFNKYLLEIKGLGYHLEIVVPLI